MYSNDATISFITIHSDNIAGALHDYMIQERAEMLALGIQEPSLNRVFHTSAVRKISTIAKYPVFFFHLT